MYAQTVCVICHAHTTQLKDECTVLCLLQSHSGKRFASIKSEPLKMSGRPEEYAFVYRLATLNDVLCLIPFCDLLKTSRVFRCKTLFTEKIK